MLRPQSRPGTAICHESILIRALGGELSEMYLRYWVAVTIFLRENERVEFNMFW